MAHKLRDTKSVQFSHTGEPQQGSPQQEAGLEQELALTLARWAPQGVPELLSLLPSVVMLSRGRALSCFLLTLSVPRTVPPTEHPVVTQGPFRKAASSLGCFMGLSNRLASRSHSSFLNSPALAKSANPTEFCTKAKTEEQAAVHLPFHPPSPGTAPFPHVQSVDSSSSLNCELCVMVLRPCDLYL